MSHSTDHKKIGVITATIVGMNAMIGAGIFSVPAALAAYVGPAGILTYAFVIIAVWCMGLSMARLAQLFPQEGSFYVYARQWGGHRMGLIAAGAYLIGLIIAMGLLSQMIGLYLQDYFPACSSFSLGIIALTALVGLNIIGVHLSQAGQMILICCTIFPLIATIIMCFLKADVRNLTPFMPYGFGNILAATKAVIFGFFGFECAASLFTVVENPQKNVSRALMFAIVLVGILYMLFVGSIILAVPLHHFADPSIKLSQVLLSIFPEKPWLIKLIHFSILSAIVGTVHSMIWAASALLISYLKKLHSRTIKSLCDRQILTQRSAVLLIGLGILITFLTLHSINLFFSLTAIFIVFAFMSSIVTLLTLPREWQSKQNIITIIGLLTATVILVFAVQQIYSELVKIITAH